MNRYLSAMLVILICVAPAWGAPGAHGPNGEHLDAPATPSATAAEAPRFEAQTDQFEIVGRFQGGELSMMVQRFATNEPVIAGEVEVQALNRTAKARFHSDLGDFSIDDEEFLKAIAVPGEHALVITVIAGSDSDLLDATLRVPATEALAHGHAHESWLAHEWPWLAGGFGALMLAAIAVKYRVGARRRHIKEAV